MGRPTLLTRDLIAEIEGYIKLGNYPIVAARAAGVSDGTWYMWLARGRAAQQHHDKVTNRLAKRRNDKTTNVEVIDLYRELVQRIEKAEAYTETRTVGTVVVAAQNDPRSAIAFLERRYPQRWRQRVTTEVVGPDGGPIQSEHIETTEVRVALDDTLAGVLEAMARAGKLPKEVTGPA